MGILAEYIYCMVFYVSVRIIQNAKNISVFHYRSHFSSRFMVAKNLITQS